MTAADIEAIRQLKARYFRTLDQKDWSGYRQVFTDDVEIDVTDDAADGRYTGTEIYLPMIESLLGTATTVHRGGQAEITVDGDTASGIWAMDDRIWFPGGATLVGSGWVRGDLPAHHRRLVDYHHATAPASGRTRRGRDFPAKLTIRS